MCPSSVFVLSARQDMMVVLVNQCMLMCSDAVTACVIHYTCGYAIILLVAKGC